MSKIKDCAEIIYEVVTYGDKNDYPRMINNLRLAVESMMIFLDADDMIEIITNHVLPRVRKSNTLGIECLNNKLMSLKEMIEIESYNED